MEESPPIEHSVEIPDGAPPVKFPDQEYSFEFSGDAREYFRIWIINLALSIVTLGVFSAWAKVRTQRYFYSNTRLAGVPFEYLAQPVPILKGRAIAFALFGSYVLAGQFSVRVQLALLALIALIAPWLIVRGLMFHARYSSWRGLTFRFMDSYGKAYRWYLFAYLLVPLTIGFGFPYIKWGQKKFVVEQHRFGGSAFDFRAGSGDFYPPYVICIGLIIVWWFVVFGGFLSLHPFSGAGAGSPVWSMYAMIGLTYLGYFLAWIYLASRITNLIYNQTQLDGYSLRSTLRARDLARLYLVNTVAVLGTLGMAVPWAAIRMARYRAERLRLIAPRDLDYFTAEPQRHESALGAELDNLFDVDIGL
jgi:uncharacterized membrane protein YjgN (DUF898 family)